MKIYLFVLVIILNFLHLLSVDKVKNILNVNDSSTIDSVKIVDKTIPKELIFADLIGHTIGITICYENMIYKIDNYQRLYFHTGIGVSLAFIVPDGIAVPITVNYVLGKNYNFEIGTGAMFYFRLYNNLYGNFSNELIKLVGNISYRYHYQNEYGDVKLFKIGFSPIYQFNPKPSLDKLKFMPSIVISIGI